VKIGSVTNSNGVGASFRDQPIIYDNLLLNHSQTNRFYFQMRLIRTVEETLLDLFTRNELFGTTHTCLGQEANAVGVINALDRDRDMIWSTHRCHGHFLAYCGHVNGLIAEIMGRITGVCGGRGGSQHLHWRNFASSGVQGGFVPAALGSAYAERDSGAIGVVFMGDGTMGEGIVYECLNLASLWSIPVLFVVEDNGIAQTTPKHLAVAGSIAKRAEAFGVHTVSCDTTDADKIHTIATDLIKYVRNESRPAWLHIHTVRLGPHSKGDDTRSNGEIEAAQARDPLKLYIPRASDVHHLDELSRDLVATALSLAKNADVACG
jgi:TPP-dependent pyruvate/acetoin dehydrogenase alpha subunit